MGDKKDRVSAELFVETWRECETVDEVAEALQMTRASAASRAYNYRKIGVHMKKMPRAGGGHGSRLDVAKLNAIATNGLAIDQDSDDSRD